MEQHIDAKGKACPIPFMLAKKQIDEGNEEFIVEVDNFTAVENLKRLAKSQGYDAVVRQEGNLYQVRFSSFQTRAKKEDVADGTHSISDWVLFLGKPYLGEGEEELGKNLVRMFLYTVGEGEDLPCAVILMNKGVFLAVKDDQCIANLSMLEKKGCSILVCGTCLNYYHLTEQVKVGTVSNMYEIVRTFEKASKVITL